MNNDNFPESNPKQTGRNINKASWSIFIFLVGAYLLMLGIGMMDQDSSFIFVGSLIMVGAGYVGYMQYLGKIILSVGAEQRLKALGSAIWKIAAVIIVGVGVMQIIFGATKEQEKFAKASNIEAIDFIRYSCQAKSTCKKYAEVRLSCAEAGSIERCINIKMQGNDYSSCTDDGSVGVLSEALTPNFAQCAGSNILSFIRH